MPQHPFKLSTYQARAAEPPGIGVWAGLCSCVGTAAFRRSTDIPRQKMVDYLGQLSAAAAAQFYLFR